MYFVFTHTKNTKVLKLNLGTLVFYSSSKKTHLMGPKCKKPYISNILQPINLDNKIPKFVNGI